MNTHNNTPPRSHFISSLGLFALGSLISTTSLDAQIAANFDDGNSTTEVDAWTGAAGDGWVNDWSVNNSTDATLNASVVNTNPLSSGTGNYLSATSSNTNAGGFRRTMIRRQYQDFGSVSLNSQHTLEFLFRLDTGLEGVDRFQFFDTDASGGPSPNSTSAWFIRDGLATRQWGFYSEDGTEQTWTDVRLYEGDTYSFSLVLDPENDSVVGTITNLDYTTNSREGNMTFTTDPLDFYGTDAASAIGGYAHWQVLMDSGSEAAPTEANWSFDGVSVIPEPSSYAQLIAIGSVLLTQLRRRR